MDLKEIQSLIRFVARSGATEVELETDGVKIYIKTKGDEEVKETTVVQHVPVTAAPQVQAAPTVPAPAAAAPASATEADSGSSAEDSKCVEINSPMIGTFYRRPSPDKDPFISVGDEVKDGSVVCVIEAMKLFNEIESEISGKIVKVLAEDSSPVEYDQPLFLVDPS
ncbi:MAG: acetyl-CoA carboxylase biotin carboxyl carrier protein [Flavobacteriales bacterium]|nr:acetyl-CoA carboxylase biotin carboxyl carrier protein [Flavobacteriales bacterium]